MEKYKKNVRKGAKPGPKPKFDWSSLVIGVETIINGFATRNCVASSLSQYKKKHGGNYKTKTVDGTTIVLRTE